ncbi:MAG: rhomboid family intramembrane serine protease [Planctomycetaceae bacterium]
MKAEPSRTQTRFPFGFTTILVVTLTIFAVWSDSHSSLLTETWRNSVGFSAMSLANLQWHQTLTSLVFTAGERQFAQSILMLCISVGLCERKFGSRTAVLVFFISHVVVTIGLALCVVLPLHLYGVEWATALASERDVGPSAGYYGCLGIVVASWSHRHRQLLTVGIIAVLIVRLSVSLGRIHQTPAIFSADLAHLASFPFGIILAQFTDETAAARRPKSRSKHLPESEPTQGRRERPDT